MSGFIESSGDDTTPEDEQRYTISRTGIEEILGWVRFQAQMCEMIHNNMEDCDEKEHEIALLMAFVLQPWIELYKINEVIDQEDDNK